MSVSITTSADQQPTTGRAPTSDRLWAALRAYPGSTTDQLAVHASVGQSTAGKVLARWVADASITRHAATGGGKGRGAATFTIADPGDPTADVTADGDPVDDLATDDSPTDVTPTASAPAADDASLVDVGSPAVGAATAAVVPVPNERRAGKQPRLSPGGLRGMVEDYLRDHQADDLGPAMIGKELTRSSGAVSNALDRLVADGYAVMTSAKPKRYRFAASPSGG